MLSVIEEIVHKVTGKSGLTPDTDFIKDLALNSFDIMTIICEFEDRYRITIPTRDVWQLRQVKDVVEYMKAKGFEA